MKSLTKIFRPKFLVAGIVLAALSVLGFNTLTHPTVYSATNPNDIMPGGFTAGSVNSFANGYTKKADIKHVYEWAGLSPDELARFKATAKPGTAYSDGRIVLSNGDLLATDASSAGRLPIKGNNQQVTIKDTKYHYGKNTGNFASKSLPVLVMLNPLDHSLEFAAIADCGNPTWGKSPGYYCDQLVKEQVDRDTFNFSTKAFTKNGATVEKVVYDFGDGSKAVTKTNPGEKVPHTYKPGNYTAKVTVHFKVNGKVKTHTRTECTKPVKVEEEKKPAYKCTSLSKHLISGTRKYKFVGTAEFKHAKLTAAAFNFGDGQTGPGTIQNGTDAATITAEHQYAENLVGKKTVTLALEFTIGNDKENVQCKTELEFKQKTCKDEPNREECQPPKEFCKPGIPKGDDRCKEILPKEIVKTGPAEIIGSALGLGSLAGAGMYYRASRKNLHNIFKR